MAKPAPKPKYSDDLIAKATDLAVMWSTQGKSLSQVRDLLAEELKMQVNTSTVSRWIAKRKAAVPVPVAKPKRTRGRKTAIAEALDNTAKPGSFLPWMGGKYAQRSNRREAAADVFERVYNAFLWHSDLAEMIEDSPARSDILRRMVQIGAEVIDLMPKVEEAIAFGGVDGRLPTSHDIRARMARVKRGGK